MSFASWTKPRRAPLPWGLLGMLGLIWGVEAWVARSPYTGQVSWSWRSAREAVESEAAGCGVLAFGDSQLKCGLLPRALEDRLGMRAYNLAVVRSQPVVSDTLLQAVLSRGVRPRAIVIDAFVGLLADPPSLNGREWVELLDASTILKLSAAARDPLLPIKTAGNWLLPSVEVRAELRSAIVAAVTRSPVPEPRLVRERRERGPNRGGLDMPDLGDFTEAVPVVAESARRAGWRCRPEHEQALRRFLARAEAEQIPVFWLVMPLSPFSQAHREQSGYAEAERAFIRGLQRDFPRQIVLDGRTLGLDKSHFLDPVHLNGQGAGRFSRAVAAAIDRFLASGSLAASRWIALDPADTVDRAYTRREDGTAR